MSDEFAPGHKRRRSLQDSPVDLTIMQKARSSLLSLQRELEGIDETQDQLTTIMAQIDIVQQILGTAKKPKVSFSSISKADLKNVGIERKLLQMQSAQLASMLEAEVAKTSHVQQLCLRIERIYRHFEAGPRMILDAVLLTVAEISSDGDTKVPVAILPEMRIASGEGVLLKNPVTDFELWVTGSVNYGLCTYEQEDLRRDRVLSADVDDARLLAKSKIFLIEAKRLQDKPLYDFMPEAIAQAVALCEVTKYIGQQLPNRQPHWLPRTQTVRFCLTDGRKWVFCLFSKNPAGERVCYEGNSFSIPEPSALLNGALWQESVRQVVELVHHWLVEEKDPMEDSLSSLQ